MTSAVTTRAADRCSAASFLWRQRGRLFLTGAVRCQYALEAQAPMARVEAPPWGGIDVPYRRMVDVTLSGHAFVAAGAAAPAVRLRVERQGQTLCDVTRRLRPAAAEAASMRRVMVEGMGELAQPPSGRMGLHAGRPVLELGAEAHPDAMQRAPLDMRLPFVHGDEWIELAGLHPGMPLFRCQLPRGGGHAWDGLARLRHGSAGAWSTQRLALDTLHLDLDAWRCTATWRGWFEIDASADLAAAELQLGVRHGAEPEWPAEDDDEVLARFGGTLDVTEERARQAAMRPALPFAGTAPAPPPSPVEAVFDSGTLDFGPPKGERFQIPLAMPAVPPPVVIEELAAPSAVEEMNDDILAALASTADVTSSRPSASTPFVAGAPTAPPPLDDEALQALALFSGTKDLTYEQAKAAAAARMTPFERDPEVKQGAHFLAALDRLNAKPPPKR